MPAILLFFGLSILPGFAQRPQLKRPEEAPEEKPAEAPKKKNVKGPRAVGVLQLNSSGKGTLVPVAILVDGKFYDASAYKADPVPMALEGGTVYEVEQCGESQGLFTVRGALHNNNPNSLTPWMGSGSYVLNGTEAAKTAQKAENKPRDLDSDRDGPPRLTRGTESGESKDQGTASNSGGAARKTGAKPEGSSQSKSPEQTKSAANPGDNTNQSSTNQSSANQGSTGQSASGKPAADATAGRASGQEANGGDSQSQGGENHYRPTLRRGKPVDSAPVDDSDERAGMVQKPGEAVKSNSGGVTPQAAVRLVPAISDAGGPEPRSFQFYWKEGEEDERRKQMLALAGDEVRAYIRMREKETIPAKTTPVTAGARTTSTRSGKKESKIEPSFEDVQFKAFDVWKNNQPVMVLSAEAKLPRSGAESSAAVYDVTIAARADIYGDLRKLYSGITDKFHLDVTPKMDLIDAVDADGDGRGELLFRETTDAGSGYLIYRPTGDTLWKMYDSLNQE